jgi:biopolymer transport protein ExbB
MNLPAFLREGGPIMPLIVVTALAGYALAVERLIVWLGWLRRDRPLMRALEPDELDARLRETLAAPRQTPFAWVLQHARAAQRLPKARREAAVQARLLACLPQVGTRIATLGWLGGMLPMLGLMGTVSGMILTFRSLAATSSRQVLSLGLAEALYATLAGLLGALPLLAAHHVLTRLKARWLLHLERCLTLLEQDAPDGEGAAAASGPAPPAATSPAAAPPARGARHEA